MTAKKTLIALLAFPVLEAREGVEVGLSTGVSINTGGKAKEFIDSKESTQMYRNCHIQSSEKLAAMKAAVTAVKVGGNLNGLATFVARVDGTEADKVVRAYVKRLLANVKNLDVANRYHLNIYGFNFNVNDPADRAVLLSEAKTLFAVMGTLTDGEKNPQYKALKDLLPEGVLLADHRAAADLRNAVDAARNALPTLVAETVKANADVIVAEHAIVSTGKADEPVKGTSVGFSSLQGAAGVPVRLNLGYAWNMGSNWFVGANGFVGRMGGSTSSNVQVNTDAVKLDDVTIPAAGYTNKFILSPGLNMGVMSKVGYEFGKNAVFMNVGWTVAKLNATTRFGDQALNDAYGPLTQSKWKHGVSVGAGFDHAMSDTVRVGVGYTATFFGATKWDNWTSKNELSAAQKKTANKLAAIKAGRLVNHTVSVGVTYVMPSGS